VPDPPGDAGRVPERPPVTAPIPVPARPARSVRAAGLVLTSEVVRGTDRVGLAGELTAATAPLLDAETVEVCRVADGPVPDLLLDLTDVTYLDVMGVAALRRAHYRAVLVRGLRVGLPVSPRPGRMLALAVDRGWLSPLFRPGVPIL
jgi:hypothetical protein